VLIKERIDDMYSSIMFRSIIFRSTIAIASALTLVLDTAAQAHEIPHHRMHARHAIQNSQTPSPHAAADNIGPWWPGPNDMGETGYYGGSSGGIPKPIESLNATDYQSESGGILPQDRPYPVWTQPGRLLR
jgi:hypothetical protein